MPVLKMALPRIVETYGGRLMAALTRPVSWTLRNCCRITAWLLDDAPEPRPVMAHRHLLAKHQPLRTSPLQEPC